MSRRPSWQQYALNLAKTAATRSEDPWMKVGACILRKDGSVASLGYNGAPPGIEIDWSDRDLRRRRVIHAEANALRYVAPGEGEFMAVTLMPCIECVKSCAAYGIDTIVYGETLNSPSYDTDEIEAVARDLFTELIPFRSLLAEGSQAYYDSFSLEEAWDMADQARPSGWGLSVAGDGPGYRADVTHHGLEQSRTAWSVDYDDEWQYGDKDLKSHAKIALIRLAKSLATDEQGISGGS